MCFWYFCSILIIAIHINVYQNRPVSQKNNRYEDHIVLEYYLKAIDRKSYF